MNINSDIETSSDVYTQKIPYLPISIIYDMDKIEYKIEGKILSFSSHSLLENVKIEELSGVMIIIDNKILLVKPKKFKGMKHKWSIPKGKLDGREKFKNALKELEEETNIILDKSIKSQTEKVNLFYKKNGQMKKLIVYVIELNADDLNIDINHKWKVDTKEIDEAKFFTKEKAMYNIESAQIPLLNIL